MKYEISEIVDPIVPEGRGRSQFRKTIEALPVGKAVIVTGMNQSNAASRARVIGQVVNPKKKFSTSKLNDGRVQILRVE